MVQLKRILYARRNDLADGFPTRAVLAAFRASDPIDKLNELLEKHQVSVVQLIEPPLGLVTNPYLLELGIIAARIEGERITVYVSGKFFDSTISTVITKALMFQSVCLHQLIHRCHGQDCQIFYRPLTSVINDDAELEAAAAGLAHDVHVKDMLSMTGIEMIQELSPRLANILDNSGAFVTGSLAKLQAYVKKYA
jgi:hypothetical protein